MNSIAIKDRVYGEYSINDPLLVELMNSRPVQRLKHIANAGISSKVIPNRNVSRYEHSVGVMKLLKDFGAPLEEQAAGLLHDVPHTVFSHVVDSVFGCSQTQDFHEKFHRDIILNSEIPEILKRFGLDVEYILDDKNFPLLERPLPDLCADRLDYSMRDMCAAYNLKSRFDELRKHLIVHGSGPDREVVFDGSYYALQFALLFMDASKTLWANPREMAAYEIFAEAIRQGLNKNIISESDLFTTDDVFFAKLENAHDPAISSLLARITPQLQVVDNPHDFDFHCKTKLRYVDPKFITQYGELRSVSEVFSEYGRMIEGHKKEMERGVYIKIVFPN